jgi:hypothetical protein
MALRSAPRLIIFAITRDATSIQTTQAAIAVEGLREAPPGNPSNARTRELDAHHQRVGHKDGPAHVVAELCTALGVSGNPDRIVVGRPRHEAWTKLAELALRVLLRAFARQSARWVAVSVSLFMRTFGSSGRRWSPSGTESSTPVRHGGHFGWESVGGTRVVGRIHGAHRPGFFPTSRATSPRRVLDDDDFISRSTRN